MMPVRPLCVPASRTSRGEDERGQGLCSLGRGEARLDGVTLWEEEARWDTRHLSGALEPECLGTRHHRAAPDACVPVRPAEGQRRAAAPGTAASPCCPCKGGAFRSFLPPRLVSSSYCGPDEPVGDSHAGAGPAPEMGPWAADPGMQAM